MLGGLAGTHGGQGVMVAAASLWCEEERCSPASLKRSVRSSRPARGVLRVRAPQVLTDARLGDSIAINGVDLTIAEIVGDTFVAHVMPETYRRSNSARLKPRERVNLERSLRPTDRLSGHIVRGAWLSTTRCST
jgi:riboflavin synthase alpha subunit